MIASPPRRRLPRSGCVHPVGRASWCVSGTASRGNRSWNSAPPTARHAATSRHPHAAAPTVARWRAQPRARRRFRAPGKWCEDPFAILRRYPQTLVCDCDETGGAIGRDRHADRLTGGTISHCIVDEVGDHFRTAAASTELRNLSSTWMVICICRCSTRGRMSSTTSWTSAPMACDCGSKAAFDFLAQQSVTRFPPGESCDAPRGQSPHPPPRVRSPVAGAASASA